MAPVAGTRTFAAGGDAYDAFMGRYAVPLAPLFADLAGVAAGQRVLDVGCGTGALTAELVRRLGAERVAGCDPSPAMLATCRDRHPEVDLAQAPAEALPFDDATFDLVLAQLVLHFATDPQQAVQEMRRVLVPGGRLAACVWDFEGGMQMLRLFWEAAVAVDANASNELRTMRFGRSGELAALFRGAGLSDVREQTLTVESRYDGFDQLWATLLNGVGPAGAYAVGLPQDQREALRSAYEERVAPAGGGFSLRAVARAAVGTSPDP